MSAFSLSLRDDRGPSAALEISGDRVSAVRVQSRAGRLSVVSHAFEALPEGLLVPSLTSTNVRNRGAVLRVLGRVLEQVGRPRRVGLVVPDPVGKVSLLKFQQVPARGQELDQLVRWQVRKTSPFPLEEARLTYAPASVATDGQEFFVTVARADVINEYESLCAEAGTHAGLVDLSTVHVINTVLAGRGASGADCLLVNVSRDWASLAILRAGHPILFRSRAADGDGTLADLVHQTAMYYEDRLSGAGFGQVLVCGVSAGHVQGADLATLRQSLGQRLQTAVSAVDPRMAVSLADGVVAAPEMLDTWPSLVGVLVRGRETAA